MTCRMIDLRRKEVINIKDGMRLGSVNDIEFDTTNARVTAIVIYGRLRFFGLFGREDDIVIRWQDIQVIGDDTILVSYNNYIKAKNPSHSIAAFFGFK
ncbi:MAG: YlmC/YmxH family sporulation protein [Oscillospiraceae bacterium]|jgi:YlmC/YmxH family sporulation protein